jgi:hypothetical protein
MQNPAGTKCNTVIALGPTGVCLTEYVSLFMRMTNGRLSFPSHTRADVTQEDFLMLDRFFWCDGTETLRNPLNRGPLRRNWWAAEGLITKSDTKQLLGNMDA